MRIVEIVLVTLLCGNFIQARDFQNQKEFDDNQGICVQEEGQENCVACLEKSQDCYWCNSDGNKNGECRSAEACPGADQQSRTCRNSQRDNENDNSHQRYNKKSERYNHDSVPRKYNHESQQRGKYDSGSGIQSKISNYDIWPRKYSNENQPRKSNHETQTRNYGHDYQPRKNSNGNQPRKYNQIRGAQNIRYNYDSQPQKFDHVNQPRKYNHEVQTKKYNNDNQPRNHNHENQPQKLSQEHQPQVQDDKSDSKTRQQHQEVENSENDQIEKELESLLVEDASIKTVNTSLFCSVSKNCSTCVTEEVCLWCPSRNRCYSYFNDSLTDLICPDKQWYRSQCRYKAHTKPCPLRNTSCDDCLSDGLCYWCKSTKQCGYYPHKNYRPSDCPKNDVYIDNCKTLSHLWVVLVPILCIIFIPVIVYIIIWLVLCCMKQAGYDPLELEEEKPKDTEKKKKPIRLQHEAMPSKTDELRKKYGLKNGESP